MTTIRCVLESTTATSKHQAGMKQGDKIILYSEWDNLSAAVASRLVTLGVQRGDRLGIFMANDWRLLALISGIMRAGAVACPISTRLPRPAVIEQLREIGARGLVAHLDASKGNDLDGLTVWSPNDVLANPEESSPGGYEMELDAPAVIIFTSGSGGKPKPAVLTYGNLYYNARGANANLRVASNEKWLLNLPMYHVSGLGVMMRCLMAGACVVIPEAAETLVASLQRYRPTHVSLVPAQLSELLDDAADQPFDSVKVFLIGGAACPPHLITAARARKWPAYLTYGMTETASQIATMPPDAPPPKQAVTAGKVLRHREVKMAEDGEIMVRGPCVFAGYWQDGAVIASRDHDGWFHTGDRGMQDNDGYLTVLGRKDALIISGGENIQPEEIELRLRGLEGVLDVLVTSVPHPKFGHRPVAFVRAVEMDPAGWARKLATTLPKFKIPDAFYPWPNEADASGLKPSRAWFANYAIRS
jgi:O-succinylbenzoic acid--CoA ligase